MAFAVNNDNDDILPNLICCTDYTQCCTDANEVSTVEIIMVTYQTMQRDDNKTELVTENKFLCSLITQTQNYSYITG